MADRCDDVERNEGSTTHSRSGDSKLMQTEPVKKSDYQKLAVGLAKTMGGGAGAPDKAAVSERFLPRGCPGFQIRQLRGCRMGSNSYVTYFNIIRSAALIPSIFPVAERDPATQLPKMPTPTWQCGPRVGSLPTVLREYYHSS